MNARRLWPILCASSLGLACTDAGDPNVGDPNAGGDGGGGSATPGTDGRGAGSGGAGSSGAGGSGGTVDDIASMESSVRKNPNSTLSAIVSIALEAEAAVVVEVAFEDEVLFRTPWTKAGASHEVPIVGMHAERDYAFVPIALIDDQEVRGSALNFRTGSLPPGLPTFTANHVDPTTPIGFTIVGVDVSTGDDAPAYVGLDDEGEPVWYYQPADGSRGVGDAKPLPDGNLLVFLVGEVRVIDLSGNTRASFAGAALQGYHHDASLIPNGNLLAIIREERTVGGDVLVGDLLREVTPSGDVAWEWSAFDHLPTDRFPGALSLSESRMGGVDWTHSNAIVYLADEDAILLSVRHQSWVLKISRATGDVLWRLGPGGDFTLAGANAGWFYNQHTPKVLDDGTLLIFDNGNERPQNPISRGVRYRLDEDAMIATQTWEHWLGVLASALGDIDMLDDGSILLCAGSVRDAPGPGTPRSELVQVAPSGDVVWALDVSNPTYRATRLPSFYWTEQ